MNILNRKIKAFTLTEVMVVLVISAIVVGLAFSVLGHASRVSLPSWVLRNLPTCWSEPRLSITFLGVHLRVRANAMACFFCHVARGILDGGG